MENIKRNKEISFLFIIIICLYTILIFSGCNVFTSEYSDGDLMDTDKKIVVIAETYEDKSFGYNSKKGIERAIKELGVKGNFEEIPIDGDEEIRNEKIRKIVSKNNLTIFVGSNYRDIAQKVSREKRVRNFVIIDDILDEPNIKSITYNHEEGGFLMGLVSGGETKSNKVGFIGGMDNENGMKLLSGYAAGVKTANNGVEKELLSKENVRFLEGYRDEEKAYKEASKLYDSGCDIIFHTCGKAGSGVFKAAKERDKKAIGIDIDQSSSIKEYENTIISSMIKNVDESLFNVSKNYISGSFKSGPFNKEELNLKNGGIDYAPSTEKHVSKNTMEKLKDYKSKIIRGEVKVPKKLFEVVEFQA